MENKKETQLIIDDPDPVSLHRVRSVIWRIGGAWVRESIDILLLGRLNH